MLRRLSGIRAKLIAMFFLIGLVPVLASGWFTVWQSEQGLIQVEASRLARLGEENRAQMDRWLEQRLAELKELAALPEAAAFNRAVVYLHLLDLTSATPGYESIHLLSPSGESFLGVEVQPGTGTARGAAPANFGDEPWFQRAMAGEDAFSQPLRQESALTAEERHLIRIASPVYGEGTVAGVIVGSVWLDALFEHVEQIVLGADAEAYLVDSGGLPLTPARSIGDGSAPLATEAAEAIRRGESGVGLYDDPAGTPVMGSYTFLPTLGWGLILEVEKGQAIASALQLGSHLRSALLYFIVGTVVIVVLAGLGAAGFITRLVLAFASPTRLIAQGNLAVPELPVHRNDELGDMARDFTEMVNHLRQTVSNVMKTSSELTGSSRDLEHSADQSYRVTSQITEAMTQVAEGAQRQLVSIQQTADTFESWRASVEKIAAGANEQAEQVEQTNQMVQQMAEELKGVAASARQVAASAEKAVADAKEGGEAVRATVEAMERIRASVSEAAERAHELGEQSQRIGEIVGIIEDIADQTNLLALNAAIEAARAGEHGRGFAVVAQEVRKLAENSANSTQQIVALIQSMQAGVASATEANAAGLSQVEKGSKLAASAGQALEKIIRAVNESHGMAHEIALAVGAISEAGANVVERVERVAAITQENTAATEQMSAASDQAGLAIENISTIAEETAAAAQEVAASAEEGSAFVENVRESATKLATLANLLDELIKRFRL